MKKNLIKKASVLAVCAAMAFGVAACGGSTDEAPVDDTQVEEPVDGEEVVDGDAEVVDGEEAPVDGDAEVVDGGEEAPVDGEVEVAE